MLKKVFKKKKITGDLSDLSSPPKTKPGDRPNPPLRGRKVTADEVRELRELIRYRYSLDAEIWRYRHVKEWDRDFVMERMTKATAALKKTRAIVSQWDNPTCWSDKSEHLKLQEIKTRLFEQGKRDWAAEPPWEVLQEKSSVPATGESTTQSSPPSRSSTTIESIRGSRGLTNTSTSYRVPERNPAMPRGLIFSPVLPSSSTIDDHLPLDMDEEGSLEALDASATPSTHSSRRSLRGPGLRNRATTEALGSAPFPSYSTPQLSSTVQHGIDNPNAHRS